MVKVTMNPREDAELPINLYWPKTAYKSKLTASSCLETLGFLTKIHPTETFGAEAGLTESSKLAFNLKVKDDIEAIANTKVPTGEPEVEGSNSKGGPTGPEQASGTHEIGTGPSADVGYDPSDFGSEQRMCPVCTFLNPSTAKECEMCGSKLD